MKRSKADNPGVSMSGSLPVKVLFEPSLGL